MDLVERSEAWNRVNKLFRNLGKDDQCALQMVAIDGMSLRQAAQKLGVPEVERCSAGRLSVAIHLFLESFDGGIECRQLPFSAITPGTQHR